MEFPEYALLNTLSFCNFPTILRFRLVCSFWKGAIESREFWDANKARINSFGGFKVFVGKDRFLSTCVFHASCACGIFPIVQALSDLCPRSQLNLIFAACPAVIINGHVEIAKYLNEHFGPIVGSPSLIHLACYYNRLPIAEFLLDPQNEIHCALNEHDRVYRTPSFFAAEHENVEMLQLLLKSGADLFFSIGARPGPFKNAIMKHKNNVLPVFISSGQVPHTNENGEQHPTWLACAYGNLEALTLFFDHEIIPPDLDSLFCFACQQNKPKSSEIVRFLISKGANVNCCKNNATPLLQSIPVFSPENPSAKILLEFGADPNFVGQDQQRLVHPLFQAVYHMSFSAIPWLLKAGADHTVRREIDDATPLILLLTLGGPISVVKDFVDFGADVNAVSRDGHSTPLICAIQCGNSAAVFLLLERGANPHFKSEITGQTPLDIAQEWSLRILGISPQKEFEMKKIVSELSSREIRVEIEMKETERKKKKCFWL